MAVMETILPMGACVLSMAQEPWGFFLKAQRCMSTGRDASKWQSGLVAEWTERGTNPSMSSNRVGIKK